MCISFTFIRQLTVALFLSRCSNFFLPVNWHAHNNRDITRTKTFKIIWVHAPWSKYPADQSHSVTSGLFPVLSDVENLILKKFNCTKRFAIKFQGESLERFFTFDSIQRVKSPICTLEPVNWQIKARLLIIYLIRVRLIAWVVKYRYQTQRLWIGKLFFCHYWSHG